MRKREFTLEAAIDLINRFPTESEFIDEYFQERTFWGADGPEHTDNSITLSRDYQEAERVIEQNNGRPIRPAVIQYTTQLIES